MAHPAAWIKCPSGWMARVSKALDILSKVVDGEAYRGVDSLIYASLALDEGVSNARDGLGLGAIQVVRLASVDNLSRGLDGY